MSPFRFSYWSDPLCIYAFVSQPTLDRIQREFGGRVRVDHHVVPVFGSVRQRFESGSWSEAGVDGRVEATARIALEHGRNDVSGECWRCVPASSWSPAAAIKAIFALADQGVIGEEQAMNCQWRLRERFFVDEVNIAERTHQLEAAEVCDIPRAPIERMLDDGSALAMVWEDHQQREALGVRGSPSYVFDGGRTLFYGNFDVEPLLATVRAYVEGQTPGGSECG